MNILLIDPPFKRFTGYLNMYYPIGLSYLASSLDNTKYNISIYDVDGAKKGAILDFSDEYRRLEFYREGINDSDHAVWNEIKSVLNLFQPDVVGITSITTKFGSVLRTANIVKKWRSNCWVIAGGPHATLLPDQVMSCNDIDIVVRGEGEETFPELMSAIDSNSRLDSIAGISFRANNSIVHNPDRPPILILDNINMPARHLLINKTNYSSEDMGVIMASRGCPFNCSYCCHIWGKKVRARSVDSVISEILFVQKEYGTKQFDFKDDSFTVNRNRTIELCRQIISKGININWGCTTRADLLDEELLFNMKAAGCNIVKIGIETGSERILKETSKGVTFEDMKKAANLLNRHKIFWSAYFMMGLPTETEMDIDKTYQFMKDINPYYSGLGIYNPFPKTVLFDQGVKMGLLHDQVELEHYFKVNPKDYFFVDPNKRVANITGKRFQEMTNTMSALYNRHNTKLINMFRRGWARKYAYSRDIRLLANDIWKAFKWLYSRYNI